MKAIIPAAGLGTRFLPIAKAVPKEMLPVGDRPVIHFVVEEALDAGFDEILIVLSRGKESIIRYFTPDPELERHLEDFGKTEALESLRAATMPGRIRYIFQPQMKGLGDAIRLGRNFVGQDSHFAVLLGDTIMHGGSPLAEMRDAWKMKSQSSVAMEPCPEERVSRYGVGGGSVLEEDGRIFQLHSVIEKPAPAAAPRLKDFKGHPLPYHAFAARYLLTPEIFDHLDSASPGKGGEIQLTDAMARVLQNSGLLGVTWNGRRLDIGNPAGLLEAAAYISGKK